MIYTKKKRENFYFSIATISILSISVVNAGFEGQKIDTLSKIDERISKDIESRIVKKKNAPTVDRVLKIPKIYGEGLYNLLNTSQGTKGFIDDKEIKLTVTVKFDRIKKEAPNASMSTTIDNSGKVVIMMDGKKIDENEIERQKREIKKRSNEYVLKKKSNIRKALKFFKMTNPFLHDTKALDKAIEDGKNSFELVLKKSAIKKFIDFNTKSLVFVSLAPTGRNTIDDAMLSTKIDPWAIDYSNRRGDDIGIYVSEWGGCPANSHISNYMRLGANVSDNHSENVTGIIREVSPDSYIYCKRFNTGSTLPNNTDRAGHSGNPEVLIESYSFAYLYGNPFKHTNQYRSPDKDWDNEVLEENEIVIVAAGNTDSKKYGDEISSPAKGFNVITVGNYDDTTDTISTTSCFLNPETGIAKPEIVAPGTTITAGGHTMTGTSMATPHVAGFAADLLSQYSWLQLRPYLFKAFLLASATKSISGGVDKVGVGGIDFYDSVYNATHQWWTGDFNYAASHDGGSDNSRIEKTYNLSSGRDIRVAISWLNDGDYTLSHRTDSHPIGKDYDLSVYDPDGNYVGGSGSWDNSYETIDFHTNKSGNYRFVVNEYRERDTSIDMFLGMSINW